jgi:hypothetical protein
MTTKDIESEAFEMGCEWDVSWAKARPILALDTGLPMHMAAQNPRE